MNEIISPAAAVYIQQSHIQKATTNLETLQAQGPSLPMNPLRLFGVGRVKEQEIIADYEELLNSRRQKLQEISSPEYREQLSSWKPWELHRESVENGNNLYVLLAKTYATHEFLEWTQEEANKYDISQDHFIAGIIETLRFMEWKTIEAMIQQGNVTTYRLPHTIIAHTVSSDSEFFKASLGLVKKDKQKVDREGRRSRMREFFSSRQPVLSALSKEDVVRYLQIRNLQTQEFRGILQGNFFITANAGETGIALQGNYVMQWFKNALPEQVDFRRTIIEEVMHYEEPERSRNILALRDQLLATGQVHDPFIAGEYAERALGIDKDVTALSQGFPSREKILEQMWRFVPGYKIT